MTQHRPPETREEVLSAFLAECLDGNPAQVETWCARHPELSDEILGLAADLLLAPSAASEARRGDADRARVASGAIARANARLAIPPITFDALLSHAGLDLPEVARKMNVDREVVAEVRAGHVRLPIAPQFVSALADVLGSSVSAIEAALSMAASAPQLGFAKAKGAPALEPITWGELIGESDMSEERKAFWLDGKPPG